MAIDTFSPVIAPTSGTKNEVEVSLNKASFGDGYVQASPKGINNVRHSLTLSWEALTPDQAKSIIKFFEDHRGYIPFYFTHSTENVKRKWTCEKWSTTYGSPNSVSATLTESFILG